MFKKNCVLIVMTVILACQTSRSKPISVSNDDLFPDEKQVQACKAIAKLITTSHYKKVELNDSISRIIFDRYLKVLDGNHNYFLNSDIKSFELYRTQLDDDVQTGNLDHAFQIFNLFQKRYREHLNYCLASLEKNFAFDKNETFVYNREQLTWLDSQKEMDEWWDRRVKYDLLDLKFENEDIVKNKAQLRKRYKNLLSQRDKLSNQDVFQYFMTAFTQAIDPHTNYFNPSNAANYNIGMSGQLEGIGVTPVYENDYLTIKAISPGGPADKSKQIGLNDRIISVAQGKDGKFQNIVGWRAEDAIGLIRGTKGTTVRLEIISAGTTTGSKPKIVNLIREKIILKDQSAQKEVRSYVDSGKMVKIGIISIPAFYIDYNEYRSGNPNYKSTTNDVRLLLDSLKREKVDGLIIDLRGNGGGYLREAVELTGLFIKSGPVVQIREARNKISLEGDKNDAVAYSGPLGVLVDRLSASASEIFAGAIQDYNRGVIIGTQTYGKGTIQSPVDLDKVIGSSDLFSKRVPTGSQNTYGQLNLTIGKFYRVTGNSTQHKGVMPDINFPSQVPTDKYGEDTEPSAMSFDVIEKTTYTQAGSVSAVLAKLKKLHDQRMSGSRSYQYLLDDIAEYKKLSEENSLMLNENEMKKKREKDKHNTFKGENQRRAALGFPLLKKGEKRKEKEDLDFVKQEAGQIMTDLIGLG